MLVWCIGYNLLRHLWYMYLQQMANCIINICLVYICLVLNLCIHVQIVINILACNN